MQSQKHLYERAKIAIYYSLLFGLSPVAISKRNGKSILFTNKILYMVSGVYLAIFILLRIPYVQQEFTNIMKIENAVYKIIYFITELGRIIGFFMLYGGFFFGGDLIIQALQKLDYTDMALGRIGARFDKAKELFSQLLHMFFIPVSFTITVILKPSKFIEYSPSGGFGLHSVIKFFVELVNLVIDSQFFLFVLSTYRYSCQINTLLDNFEMDKKQSDNEKLKKIKLLMRLHSNVADVAGLTVAMYGAAMLTIVADDFGCVLISLFYAYNSYEKKDYMGVTVGILLFGLRFLKASRKIIIGQLTTTEEKKTKTIVHRILLQTKNKLIVKELSIFSKQLLHYRIRFKAGGVYPLDATAASWTIGFTPSIIIGLWQFNRNSSFRCASYNTSEAINSTTL